jgi:thiosulfate/3-mercaptopyruvate sulfurtransferase
VDNTPSLVSADWLAGRLDDADIAVVDASVHLPDTGRDAHAEYLQEHIPGAQFFDLAEIADPDNPLPRKVPPADIFAQKVGALGISNDTHVVAYDTLGLYSAARVWWLFRLHGHHRVSVLDGGLKEWKALDLPTEDGPVSLPAATFDAGDRTDLFASWRDVLEASKADTAQILDARTAGRFAGTEEDRYPGTRSGHIPGSLNLYWADLLQPERRTLLTVEEISDRLDASGLRNAGDPVILTCGSGLTACILALGMELSGRSNWRVYDGSWDEWGRRSDLPYATGLPGDEFVVAEPSEGSRA